MLWILRIFTDIPTFFYKNVNKAMEGGKSKHDHKNVRTNIRKNLLKIL